MKRSGPIFLHHRMRKRNGRKVKRMNINRAPESVQRELASWAWRGAKKILKDPETRKEFEQWKAQKKSADSRAED